MNAHTRTPIAPCQGFPLIRAVLPYIHIYLRSQIHPVFIDQPTHPRHSFETTTSLSIASHATHRSNRSLRERVSNPLSTKHHPTHNALTNLRKPASWRLLNSTLDSDLVLALHQISSSDQTTASVQIPSTLTSFLQESEVITMVIIMVVARVKCSETSALTLGGMLATIWA